MEVEFALSVAVDKQAASAERDLSDEQVTAVHLKGSPGDGQVSNGDDLGLAFLQGQPESFKPGIETANRKGFKGNICGRFNRSAPRARSAEFDLTRFAFFAGEMANEEANILQGDFHWLSPRVILHMDDRGAQYPLFQKEIGQRFILLARLYKRRKIEASPAVPTHKEFQAFKGHTVNGEALRKRFDAVQGHVKAFEPDDWHLPCLIHFKITQGCASGKLQ